MRYMIVLFAAAFALAAAFSFPIRADTPAPADMVQSRDGKELRKIYVLPLEDDPACIPTDDFEQDGFHYSFSELLRQEQEEAEEREHSETLTANSARNDTASVLAPYTVSARYTGTVSRTIVKSVRYEAVFSGTPIPIETPEPTPAPTMTPIPTPTPTPTPTQEPPPTPEPREAPSLRFNWLYVWIPLGVLALGGGAIAVGLIVKRRAEYEEDDDDEEE